ncbi:hypothetical protein HPB47_017515 [Ixodes persulcatus]|uniref:Uncharacterized protein n=1 Tax=Ixodes persulcatus TaxID=34615 RepID=A0AC60QN35_IXOPE|nr:hypothetical protein HPB47_017515 [Ixodes persulcatus]
MLGVTVLQNIAVTTYLSRPPAQSRGIVRPRFEAERSEVVEGISSSVPIQRTDVFARGRTIKLHFDGPRPRHVGLWGLRLPVEAAHPRPIQCGACGKLGHTRGACRNKNQCPYCCGAHPKHTCRSSVAKCPNCGADHDAFDRRGTERSEETYHPFPRARRCPGGAARPLARGVPRASATKTTERYKTSWCS